MIFGAVCALGPSLAMWGFTVDDALIAIRYAHHLATGAGYRFDPHGPSTDGVTPLPWSFLLAPFARGDALDTLASAKTLGVAAWTVAAVLLAGHAHDEARDGARDGARDAPRWAPHLALATMALAFPVGAWAASGMETGVATALATIAATQLRSPKRASAIAGFAASLRPELVVWAVALGVGAALGHEGRDATQDGARRARTARDAALAAAIAATPFALCAAIRLAVFGRAAPLALLAKPSDLGHGMVYAAAAVLVLLVPVLAFAPLAIARADGAGRARVIAVAFLAHVAAVVAAGGDWMPYARLVVPVAPSLVLVFVASVARMKRAVIALRVALAFALGIYLAVFAAPAGRRVDADRRDLIERARPLLARATTIAALDVGWPSAAAPDATIVDLAGLTDPAIAALPGGHTSKRVDVSMLLDRNVDTMIAYVDARGELRVAEARIVNDARFDDRFEEIAALPLGTGAARYVFFARRTPK